MVAGNGGSGGEHRKEEAKAMLVNMEGMTVVEWSGGAAWRGAATKSDDTCKRKKMGEEGNWGS